MLPSTDVDDTEDSPEDFKCIENLQTSMKILSKYKTFQSTMVAILSREKLVNIFKDTSHKVITSLMEWFRKKILAYKSGLMPNRAWQKQ